MSIVRVHQHERDFSIIGNAVLRNAELSFRARGVLAWLLSHPTDWSVSSESIADAGVEGRDAVRAAMAELRDAGHLVYRKERVAGGRLSTVIDVYEVPTDAPVSSGIPAANEEAAGAGIPGAGPTRGNDTKPLVAPETGKPEAGKPGAFLRTVDKETTDTSLRSVSAAETPQTSGSQISFPDPELLRQRFLVAGYTESQTTPWRFSAPDRRTRDLLFEALREVTGIDDQDFTEKARGSFNAALKELREVGASPRELIVRARRLAQRVGRFPTPHELALRWAEVGGQADARFSKKPDPVAEAAEQARRVVGAPV